MKKQIDDMSQVRLIVGNEGEKEPLKEYVDDMSQIGIIEGNEMMKEK
jgi:hypothetical protein